MLPAIKKFNGLPRFIRYLVYVAITAVVLFVLFVFVIPAVVKAVAVSQIGKTLGRKASIESLSFNPALLTIEIKGFAINEPDSDKVFVSFDLLRIDAEIVSAFKRGAVIKEINLVKPYVKLVRKDTNTYNFTDLLVTEKKDTPKEPQKPFRFSLNNIRISDGEIEFEDMPMRAKHTVTALNLGVPLVSNFDYDLQTFVQPSFSANLNGRPFSLAGKSKPFTQSQESKIDVDLKDVNLPEYLAYVPVKLNFKMPTGRLSTKIRVSYILSGKEKPQIKLNGLISLSSLDIITPDDKPILSIPSFSIRGFSCKVNNRELDIDEVSTSGIKLYIKRGKGGVLNLQTLTVPGPEEEKKPAPPAASAAEPAWTVMVKKCAFSDIAIHVTDNSTTQPLAITADKMNLKVDKFSTAKDSSADIDFMCKVNDSGSIGVQGTFMLNPLTLNLNLNLDAIDIRSVQSYLPDNLKLLITGGNLGLKGTLIMKPDKNSKPTVSYMGDMGLSGFSTIDKRNSSDLLKFTALNLTGIRAEDNPLSLDINTIKLSGLNMKPVIEADGSLNLASVAEGPEPAPAQVKTDNESTGKSPVPNINIGNIIFENGRIAFTDKTMKPRYSTELANINGVIKGISFHKDTVSDIRLSGLLNRYAPLTVTGKVTPLQEKPFVDLKIAFKNIDLSLFTPYSGKYVGRAIEKGRLSLDLEYLIKDNKLTAQNKVFLDQFTLGKDVDSPDATSLPVGLAISLLKDRKGEIHLDMPLTGSLDDPEFSITTLLLKTLVNLIEKAAISPFSLISGAFTGGGDLSQVLFDCGSAVIKDEEAKKLDALADVLADKTDLKLEIAGHADTEKDREGMKEIMFLNKIKAQKLKDVVKKNKAAASVDEITVEQDEYEQYLTKAYKAERFSKPSILGIPKSLPPEEMKKLMIENSNVTDDDLKQLMEQRALAVKNRLADSGKVQAERLFILDSSISEEKGAANECRVEFKLK